MLELENHYFATANVESSQWTDLVVITSTSAQTPHLGEQENLKVCAQ